MWSARISHLVGKFSRQQTCGRTGTCHVDMEEDYTCPIQEVTCGPKANVTRGEVERWHMSEPGCDTWSKGKVTRGQAGTWHVVELGGSWNFDTWPFPSWPQIHLPAKCAAGMAPNGVDGVPRHLPVWTGIRGSGHPVMFLRCITEAKIVRWWKFLHRRKNQFHDVYGRSVAMQQTLTQLLLRIEICL